MANHRTAVYVRTANADNEYRERAARLVGSLNHSDTIKADVFSIDGNGNVAKGLVWNDAVEADTDASLVEKAREAGYVQAVVVTSAR